MEGFGSSSRVFDDPHLTETFDPVTGRGAILVPASDQAAILDALYVELGLTRIRPNLDGGIEPVNDNVDPLATDLSQFNFAWKRNDAHVDHVKTALNRGLTTTIVAPLQPESWMDESNPEEFVEWALAVLRRWRELGVEPPYYSVLNEPGNPYGGRPAWSGEYVRDLVKLLGPALQAEGFTTKLMLPDDLNPDEAYERAQVVLADPDAAPYVGVLAYHLYGGSPASQAALKDLAADFGLPLWMSEFAEGEPFEWANIMHSLIAEYGVSAVDSMWGFFGQWDVESGHLIEIRYDHDYDGWVRTKRFYYTGQYSKFVPQGAVRVSATSTDAEVKVTAYTSGADVVVVLTNNATATRRTRIELADATGLSGAAGLRTSASENWVAVGPLPIVQDGLNVDLPAESVTTLTIR